MAIEIGDKMLIAHRRLFEGDSVDIFIGSVTAYGDGICKVLGHSWTWDPFAVKIERTKGIRTKVVAVASGTHVIYQLPHDADMESLAFVIDPDGRLQLEDATGLKMEVSDRGARR